MDDMTTMMDKMMGNAMGSGMPTMMDKMFSAMPPEQRIEFVTTMMPRCLSMVLDSLDQPGRERLAHDMVDSFTRLAERYVATDDTPGAPGPEVSTSDETGVGGNQP